ncbi:MAG: TlpA disulfide reductase family protein [Pseudomonadota bacterium]
MMINKTLIRMFISLAVITAISVLSDPGLASAPAPPNEGSTLPAINLPVPNNPNDRNYLGVTGSGSFQIPQIRSKVVIIEIYSMYCPYCQREAPLLNSLYEAIEKDPGLKGKIKLIGIGAGNSPFEVGVFKDKYNIAFPLFADENFTAHKHLGETRTPYFIAIKINDDGSHKVIYSKLGSIKGVEPFLKLIAQLSGLEEGSAK